MGTRIGSAMALTSIVTALSGCGPSDGANESTNSGGASNGGSGAVGGTPATGGVGAGGSEPGGTGGSVEPGGTGGAAGVPAQADYPKGVWGLGGPDPDIPPELAANKGLVGIAIGTFDWRDVEKLDGVYNFQALDDKIAKAKTAGFSHLVVGVTASAEETPAWLVDELQAAGQTITFLDPGHSDTTYGLPIITPLPWNKRWHQKRLALIAAVGAHYSGDPTIVGTWTSFANHRTNDWNITDTDGPLDNVQAERCSPPVGSYTSIVKNSNGTCNITVDMPQQWLDAGWTREQMEAIGKEIITANAKAWPGKVLKLPIGGLNDRLANTSPDPRGGPGNYSTMAYNIVSWIDTQTFRNSVFISRNTVAANWGPPPSAEPQNYGSEAYIKWLVAQRAPLSGLQTVTSASMCIPDGTTPCRLNSNEPTTDLKDVMQRALDAMVGYHVTFAEEWYGDAKNPLFYDMTSAATIAMGGTPRK